MLDLQLKQNSTPINYYEEFVNLYLKAIALKIAIGNGPAEDFFLPHNHQQD